MGEIAEATEVAIIGAGPGGYAAALQAAKLGKDVTLIEQDNLGGVCLQHGCIPSKAIIHVANLFYDIKQAGPMGIRAGQLTFNAQDLQQWKSTVVGQLTKEAQNTCKQLGITVIQGKAAFAGPRSLLVQDKQGEHAIEFEHAVIATGSAPRPLPNLSFDKEYVLSSTEALDLSTIPTAIIIVGGGYIGLEIGTALVKLGSRVTIIEATSTLLPGIDQELVSVVEQRLKAIGIKIMKDTLVKGVDTKKKTVIAVSKTASNEELKADKILVCVGRVPNGAALQLEKAGVKRNDDGTIIVDSQLRTANQRIFAIGDIIGEPLLAHKATRQGKVAAEVIAGKNSAYDSLVVPAVIFTDPEIATVGMTEQEAKSKNCTILIGKAGFKASGKAWIMGHPEGMVKVIADAATKRILGVHVVGDGASEMISEATLAIEMGALVDDLALTIHPHPTWAEALMEACEKAAIKK